MVLCEKLLSGNFCILVAEASARSQSDAHPELCTVAADGMLPGQQLKARHGTCSLCPRGYRFFGSEIPSVVQALPGSPASSRSPVHTRVIAPHEN